MKDNKKSTALELTNDTQTTNNKPKMKQSTTHELNNDKRSTKHNLTKYKTINM